MIIEGYLTLGLFLLLLTISLVAMKRDVNKLKERGLI